ncbi:unnamed protein product [Closterium sp. NIES-54]
MTKVPFIGAEPIAACKKPGPQYPEVLPYSHPVSRRVSLRYFRRSFRHSSRRSSRRYFRPSRRYFRPSRRDARPSHRDARPGSSCRRCWRPNLNPNPKFEAPSEAGYQLRKNHPHPRHKNNPPPRHPRREVSARHPRSPPPCAPPESSSGARKYPGLPTQARRRRPIDPFPSSSGGEGVRRNRTRKHLR